MNPVRWRTVAAWGRGSDATNTGNSSSLRKSFHGELEHGYEVRAAASCRGSVKGAFGEDKVKPSEVEFKGWRHRNRPGGPRVSWRRRICRGGSGCYSDLIAGPNPLSGATALKRQAATPPECPAVI